MDAVKANLVFSSYNHTQTLLWLRWFSYQGSLSNLLFLKMLWTWADKKKRVWFSFRRSVQSEIIELRVLE